MTLSAFIKKMGSREAAAAAAGVSIVTYWRWMTGRTKPRGNDMKQLIKLGVKW